MIKYTKISDFFKSVKEMYLKNKKQFIIVIIAIFFLIAILFLPTKNKEFASKQPQVISSNSKTYYDMVEEKLSNMILKIKDVKFVDILILTNESEKKNYLMEKEKTTSSGEIVTEKEKVVYDKNGSSQSPILVSVDYPKVIGVLVVLNKVNASTKVSIQNSISGVLNIESNSIFILQDE